MVEKTPNDGTTPFANSQILFIQAADAIGSVFVPLKDNR